MKIKFPQSYSIDELNGKFLWRYIDLYRLINLIQSQQLYFTRFDHFEDGVEGLTGCRGMKFFTQGQAITKENINKEIDEKTQDIIIAGDERRRKEYSELLGKIQQTQFASCWFMGDRESIAMWKLYSTKGGVAIKFKARQLTDTIIASAKSITNTDFGIFYYGPVSYKNIWPFDPEETLENKYNGLNKDKSYSFENEFRFVAVVSSDKKGTYSSFKLPIGQIYSFDLEVIANPFMEHWQFESLKQLLRFYHFEDKLLKSKMDVRK